MKRLCILGLFFIFIACATTPHKSSGIIYMQQGLYQKAVVEFQGWVNENPNNAEAHLWLGRAYIGVRDYIKAAEEFAKAYELDADSGKLAKEFGENEVNTLLTAGKTLFQQGDDKGALRYFEYASKINPRDERPFIAIAIIKSKQGQHEESINYATKALELKPNDAQAYYYRAKFYSQMGNREKAIEDLKKAVEIDTTFSKAYFDLGTLYFENEQYENAAQSFLKAYSLDHNFDDALLNTALCYFKLSNYPEAEKYFKMYLDKNSDAYDIWFYYAIALYNQNKYNDALYALDKATELKPDYEDAYSFKALIYNQLKMPDKLNETLKKIQEIQKSKNQNGGK